MVDIRLAAASDAAELKKLTHIFNERGVTRFHVSTGEDNTAALALYRSLGYDGTSIMLEKSGSS